MPGPARRSLGCTARLTALPLLLFIGLASRGVKASERRWDELTLGSGEDHFTVALLADMHSDIPNLGKAVDSINDNIESRDIQLAIVLGDMTSTALGSQFEAVKEELDRLLVPYVPLIGNHDVWPYIKGQWKAPKFEPSDPESLMTTRFFDAQFADAYSNLESISDSGDSSVRNFSRYEEHPWNFETRPPYCYDLYENFGFDAGPPGSKWHFMCLDFNCRDYHWADTWGVSPEGDLHLLPFNDLASSVEIVADDTALPVTVKLYTDIDYGGDAWSLAEAGQFNMAEGFDNEVSSVELIRALRVFVWVI